MDAPTRLTRAASWIGRPPSRWTCRWCTVWPPVIADVRHEPVAGIGHALGSRQVRRDREQPPEQRPVRLAQVGRRGDVRPRDQQDVGRRLGLDVADRDDQVVVVDPRGRQLAVDDAAEQARLAIGHGRLRHHNTGLVLIRNPIVPTSPAIRYEM